MEHIVSRYSSRRKAAVATNIINDMEAPIFNFDVEASSGAGGSVVGGSSVVGSVEAVCGILAGGGFCGILIGEDVCGISVGVTDIVEAFGVNHKV